MSLCKHAERDFSAYWEADLTADRRRELEEHWESCAACRAAYESFVAAIQAVHALPRLEAPAGFAARVVLESRERAARRGLSGVLGRLLPDSSRPLAWGWRAGLAAAAVLAVVVGVRVMNRPQAPSPGSLAVRAPVLDTGATPEAPPPALPRAAAPEPASESARRVAPGSSELNQALREAPSRVAALEALPAGRGAATPSLLDSLLHHEMDVEFALDRIHLRQVRGDSAWTPVLPMPGAPEGKPASLTF
jgi:anti-sigma factor RsiW